MRLPYKSGDVRVTSPFGMRTLNGKTAPHKGIDLVGSDKTIVAATSGVVRVSTMLDRRYDTTQTWEWGNYVRVDGDDGLMYYYCHMSKRLVSAGTRVREGDVLGIEGNTGYSFGSHCHFEVRKNGVSINPAELLGIKNVAGLSYPANGKVVYPDEYSHDGLTFVRAKNFAIRYYDAPKKQAQDARYINAGFFGNYRDSKNVIFTLPVANLMCDINTSSIYESARKYITPYINGRKLRYGTANNATQQYKGKKVATLIVPNSGKPYISDVIDIPANTAYAISGVPTVRNGDDVDYYNYVKPQGWDESCMGAAQRNWVGVRDGEIWIITGATTARNYIYGMEFWKKVKDEKFDDIICLDGGGSYVYKNKGTVKATFENRRINSLITF